MTTVVPTLQKKRGAYYTPRELSDFLVAWAIQTKADRVLDPSCGEAVFLESAVARIKGLGGHVGSSQIGGFEINSDAAEIAAKIVPEAVVINADFFSVRSERPTYDAVVGNPPYIRYHHFTGSMRARALEVSSRHGVRLTELTSSWAPFLVHASTFLSPEGRMALVLPMELLVTDYAAPVRTFLQSRFARVEIITFEERIFPGAMVDAVLLLADGIGPGDVRVHRVQNLSELDAFNRTKGLLAAESKWTNALVDQRSLDAFADASAQMQPLGSVASVDIGVVTGANRFFLLSDHSADEHELAPTDLQPALARAQHVPGSRLTRERWEELRQLGEPVWLFAPDQPDESARTYIRSGEADGVDQAYKCRVRKEWWRLNLPKPPDLFLSYMSNRVPRLIENHARALSTNLLHNVRLTAPSTNARWMALSWMNSATMLSCELSGRAYGGGVLKLETREAERVMVPVYDQKSASRLESVADRVDQLLSDHEYIEVAKIIDPIVLPSVSNDDAQSIRDAWIDLQLRRRKRSTQPMRRGV